jgi:hypothetical protein
LPIRRFADLPIVSGDGLEISEFVCMRILEGDLKPQECFHNQLGIDSYRLIVTLSIAEPVSSSPEDLDR